MRTLLLSLILLAGCCSPEPYERPDWGGQPYDTTWLLEADPAAVTTAGLAAHAETLEAHYEAESEALGVCWQPVRTSASLETPDAYGSGGDSCLFTGVALAAWALKYKTTGESDVLAQVARSLSGLHLLTNATGTPGVLCRAAFPVGREAEWFYPQNWLGRIERGFVGRSPAAVPDPILGGSHPPTIYYTRATKDQVTGLAFGLGAAWAFVPQARPWVALVIEPVVRHLLKHSWYIRDEKGENDTSADYVDGLLRTQLLAVYRRAVPGPEAEALWEEHREVWSLGDLFNAFSNRQQYFAWNLRYTRALTLVFVGDEETRQEAADYIEDWLWPHTKDHQSVWFAFARGVATGEFEADGAGLLSLKDLSLKPLRNWPSPYAGQERRPNVFAVLARCTGAFVLPPRLRKSTTYWTWQKKPWDTGALDEKALGDATGLDYLLPYWLGRAFGVF